MRKRQTKETLSQLATIPQLLSIPEVAKALSIGRTKVYDLINHDGLPTVQIGKGKRVAVLALQRWIEEHGQAS
jgi:excisionase family DNA binding protein